MNERTNEQFCFFGFSSQKKPSEIILWWYPIRCISICISMAVQRVFHFCHSVKWNHASVDWDERRRVGDGGWGCWHKLVVKTEREQKIVVIIIMADTDREPASELLCEWMANGENGCKFLMDARVKRIKVMISAVKKRERLRNPHLEREMGEGGRRRRENNYAATFNVHYYYY